MRALVLWCSVRKIFDDKNALQDAQYSKLWKKYSASWSVVLSSNIFWMLHHKTSTRIFFKQREQTENLKQWLHIHIYLVIIYCALFAIFRNTVRRRLVLPKKFLTVCRRTKHTVFIYKREYYMFLVPSHDIHFKIIWPEKKKCPKSSFFVFGIRNSKHYFSHIWDGEIE